jgi:hypothetical protein
VKALAVLWDSVRGGDSEPWGEEPRARVQLGGIGAAAVWDSDAVVEALVEHGADDDLCEKVARLVDGEYNSVPLSKFGDLLLRDGGVPPLMALRVVHNLVKVQPTCSVCGWISGCPIMNLILPLALAFVLAAAGLSMPWYLLEFEFD